MEKTGTTWNFTYDADGLRTSRSNGTTAYNYVYSDGQLRQMTCGSNKLVFAYGVDGRPYALQYNGTYYYYLLNLQGDVIGIANTSGTQVVSYAYDPWGNILSVTDSTTSGLGQLNPLRYRGYVYDTETQLYYLQSRYYNPEMGRFISVDCLLDARSLVGHNLFAYCLNNPVSFIDETGSSAVVWWLKTMGWLPAADGALPVGEIALGVGLLIAFADDCGEIIQEKFFKSDARDNYEPPSPDDDDDDYYDDDDNFGGRERIGRVKGNTPRSNKKQNSDFEYVVKKTGIKPDKVRPFHDSVSGGGGDKKELLEVAKWFVSFIFIFFD